MLRIQIMAGAVSIILLVIVFELIRRRRLREEYSLLWLLSGILILVISIFPKLFELISKMMGMYYLTALLVLSFLFLLMIVLQFSTVISQLSERNKDMTQELAIMDFKFKQIEEQLDKLISEKE